jgi:predicted glycoside hydrolase/deacetylase ChbG (UPF0249 family)
MAVKPIRLIVNADDYGYFPCVSRGILKAAAFGTVTATGILANGPKLDEQIAWLSGCANLDLGVHLNLTSRHPLTSTMAEKLEKWEGRFPSAFAMTGEILCGRISLDSVCAEWRAQIEMVLGLGIELQFLNSHEHIHMLPQLFKLAMELAKEYQIPYLRLTRAEWLHPFYFSCLLRNLLLQAMESVNVISTGAGVNAVEITKMGVGMANLALPVKASLDTPSLNSTVLRVGVPLFIGLSRSGKLDWAYLSKRFATLKPSVAYELMCHPGFFDAEEIADTRLLAYHAWQTELTVLTSPEFNALCAQYNIQLVNYRELHD